MAAPTVRPRPAGVAQLLDRRRAPIAFGFDVSMAQPFAQADQHGSPLVEMLITIINIAAAICRQPRVSTSAFRCAWGEVGVRISVIRSDSPCVVRDLARCVRETP